MSLAFVAHSSLHANCFRLRPIILTHSLKPPLRLLRTRQPVELLCGSKRLSGSANGEIRSCAEILTISRSAPPQLCKWAYPRKPAGHSTCARRTTRPTRQPRGTLPTPTQGSTTALPRGADRTDRRC